jgi:hypothetical protein
LKFESGKGLALPPEMVSQLQDTVVVAAWVKLTRTAKDATWQPMLPLNRGNDWKDVVVYNLRWNRFILKAGNKGQLDTRRVVEAQWWVHLMMVRDAEGGEVFVNGKSFGKMPIGAIQPQLEKGVLIGSGEFQGEICDLRIFDQPLSPQEVTRLLAVDLPPPLPGENDPAPNIAGKTLGQIAKHNRYLVKDLKKYFPPIEKWGGLGIKPAPQKMASNFARERFKKPPKPYVHPRIYFNPEDLPDIRQRLRKDHLARTQMELIRGRLLQIALSGLKYGVNSVPRVSPGL